MIAAGASAAMTSPILVAPPPRRTLQQRSRQARSGGDERMGRRTIAVSIMLTVLYVIVGELIIFGDELGPVRR